jgi:hypothetical protein
LLLERAMTSQMQNRADRPRKGSRAVAVENDNWVWGVIFTSAALTGLFVATVFVVAI